MLMPRMFKKEEVIGAIEDFLSGTDIDTICGQFSIERRTFRRWLTLYTQSQNQGQEKVLEQEMNNRPNDGGGEYDRKTRRVLSFKERLAVVEAIRAGGTRTAVAERFDVAPTTIKNIMDAYERGEIVLPGTSHLTKTPNEHTPKEKIDDIEGIYFEGDYIIIKVLKKNVTRSLLKDLL